MALSGIRLRYIELINIPEQFTTAPRTINLFCFGFASILVLYQFIHERAVFGE
jgi:hypothetical protein